MLVLPSGRNSIGTPRAILFPSARLGHGFLKVNAGLSETPRNKNESGPTLWQLRRSIWLAQQVHETGPLGAAQWVGIASFHWSIKCLEVHAQGESITERGDQGSVPIIRQDTKVAGRAPDLRALARSSNVRLQPASVLPR